MDEIGFGATGIAWNEGSGFWPDWNVFEWRKWVLARLVWLGIEEVIFCPTGMAWNGGSGFWPDWTGLE
jgi:hypothetical protein